MGNPDLEPEEAFQVDAGLIVKPFSFLSLEAVFFNQNVTNLIQWIPGPNGQWRPGNVGKVLIRGVEGEVKTLFSLAPISSYLEIRGNYAYLIARNMVEESTSFGLQLPRRPFEKANVSAALSHVKGHSFLVEGRFVGFRFITAQNTKFLPSYFVLDSAITVSLTSQFTVTLSGKNLLNTAYVDVREYPVPGRELSVSGRLEL
jgi:outer membrane receptor protein involved in Fe transport